MDPDPLPPHVWEHARWIWLRREPHQAFYRAVFVRQVERGQSVRAEIWLTSDALHEFTLNGRMLARGPQRSDPDHHVVDRLDVVLDPGEATLVFCGRVIPPNPWLPSGVMAHRAGWLLAARLYDASGACVATVATGEDWSAAVDPAFDRNACDDRNWDTTPMGAVGYGELLDFGRWQDYPQRGTAATLPWEPAQAWAAAGDQVLTGKRLGARRLPLPEMTRGTLGTAFVPGQGDVALPHAFGPEGGCLFLEHPTLTTGYPELAWEGESGRRVRIRYAECLRRGSPEVWREAPSEQAARAVRCHRRQEADAATDLPPMAYYDELLTGGDSLVYTPGYLRTFRYLKIEVGPGAASLRLLRGAHTFSAYPLERRWSFACGRPELEQVAETAYRTLRLCLHDHFEDCPYYERLQYAGDTGLQARLTCLTTGDVRPWRQALQQLACGRSPLDPRLTTSRHPAREAQTIPLFSLLWIAMLEDWHCRTGDLTLVQDLQARMKAVLDFFQEQEHGGFLRLDDCFIDWAWGHCLQGFRLPRDAEKRSALVNLQAVWCLEAAGRLWERLENPKAAAETRALAERLRAGVRRECLDALGVLDAPGRPDRSQHGQIWAILADLVPPAEQAHLFDAAMTHASWPQMSLYQTHYAFRAAAKLGRYAAVVPALDRWVRLLDDGRSTFPEEEGRHGFIRSECHAWSAWVLEDCLTHILGVRPQGPRQVVIAPEDCGLSWARGQAALPALGNGPPPVVTVHWRRDGASGIVAEVQAPDDVLVLPGRPDITLRRG